MLFRSIFFFFFWLLVAKVPHLIEVGPSVTLLCTRPAYRAPLAGVLD